MEPFIAEGKTLVRLVGRFDRIIADVALNAARRQTDPSYQPGEPLWAGIDLSTNPLEPELESRVIGPELSAELLQAMADISEGKIYMQLDARRAVWRAHNGFKKKLEL